MRAYPRRWRRERGEELLGLLLDLTPADAPRLPLRAALDLVVAGWALRARSRPPFLAWLLYRSVDRRIPRPYAGWADDDIAGSLYPVRAALGSTWWLLLLLGVASPLGVVGLALGLGLVELAVVGPDSRRAQARLKHVAVRAGERLVAGSFVACPVPRPRVAALPGASWAAAVLAVVAASGTIAALVGPSGVWVVPVPDEPATWEIVVGPLGGQRGVLLGLVVIAATFGLVGGLVAARNLGRRVPERAEQPYRDLGPVTGRRVVRRLLLCVGAVALAWLEVSGGLVVGISVVMAAIALAFLPGALATVVTLRRSPDLHGMASSDLWWLATGRPAPVDGPARGVAPVVSPAPGHLLTTQIADPPWPAVGQV